MDEPQTALEYYRMLQTELLALRAKHPEENPEEEALLDRMDLAWYNLTDEERAALNTE